MLPNCKSKSRPANSVEVPFLDSPSSKNYDRLPLIEEEDGQAMEKESPMGLHRTQSVRHVWQDCLEAPKTLVIAASLATILVLTVIVSSFTNHTPGSYVQLFTLAQKNSPRPDFKDPFDGPIELAGSHRCGSYPSEAGALGCVFDIMNYGWTASECYYEDLAMEGLSHGPWKWYLDPDGTVEIPQDDQVLGRAVEVWTELGYHLEHCKYTQKIMQRAANNDDVLVPQELAQRNHTKHCYGLVNGPQTSSPLVVNTWVRTLYNPCVRLSQVELE